MSFFSSSSLRHSSISDGRHRPTRLLLSRLSDIWKEHKLQAGLNLTIGLFSVLTDLAFVWATKLAIDIATHVQDGIRLRTAVFILLLIVVFQLVLSYASKWIKASLGVNAQNAMRSRLFSRLLDSDWSGLKRFHTGNLTNRLEQDVSTITTFITENIPVFITTCTQFVGAFLLLFFMDRRLACIVVLILPFFLLCSRLYVKKMRKISRDIREEESHIQATMQESLQHSLIVKTLQQTTGMAERLGKQQHEYHVKVLRRTRYSSLSSLILNAGFSTGYLVTFIWGVGSLQQGLITYGALVAFIQLVGQIQGPVRTLSRFVPIFISAFTATERLMELEDIPREDSGTEGGRKRLLQHYARGGVRFSHVTYAYPLEGGKTGRNVLDDLSFDFTPGSVTAILGETGTGKTTLIRLILALARPISGQVEIYSQTGESIEATPESRTLFSYVPQGNTLLSGTIRENLSLARPGATDEEMKQVLHLADADFIFEKAHGLDTVCGEMGNGLSEGQAQRISIARALLHDRPILLLDEATSALDIPTEKRVLQRIVSARPHTTVIVVTHRPAVLEYCHATLNLGEKKNGEAQ